MSKQILNIMSPRQEAEGKTYWSKHGILIMDGDKVSIKMESLPVGEWSGWFSCFPPNPKPNN